MTQYEKSAKFYYDKIVNLILSKYPNYTSKTKDTEIVHYKNYIQLSFEIYNEKNGNHIPINLIYQYGKNSINKNNNRFIFPDNLKFEEEEIEIIKKNLKDLNEMYYDIKRDSIMTRIYNLNTNKRKIRINDSDRIHHNTENDFFYYK